MLDYSLAYLLPSLLEDDLSLLRGSLPHVDWVPRKPLLLPLCHFKSNPSNSFLEEFHYNLSAIKWDSFPIFLQNISLEYKNSTNQNFIELRLALSDTKDLKYFYQKVTHLLHKNHIEFSKKKEVPHYLLGRIDAHYQDDAIRWAQRYHLFKSQEIFVEQLALIEAPPLTKKKAQAPLTHAPHIIEIYPAQNALPS